MTSYSALIKENRIKEGKFSKKQIQDCLNLARRDIKTSKKIADEDPDWGYNIAYNSMLQAARALMFSKGFRATGDGQHATTIQFSQATLGYEYTSTFDFMDRMRRKRHQSVYEIAGLVSSKEALEAIETAENFVNIISVLLKKG